MGRCSFKDEDAGIIMIALKLRMSYTQQTLELGESMNVHEYQAKDLMRKFGIKVLTFLHERKKLKLKHETCTKRR